MAAGAQGVGIRPGGRWLAAQSEGLRLSVIPVGGGKRVLELEPGAGNATPGMGRWSRYGRAFAVASDEVGPWLADPVRDKPSKAPVAWEGLSEAGEALHKVNRLYSYRWRNPRPQVAVDRISWIGGGQTCGLRVAGVTAFRE